MTTTTAPRRPVRWHIGALLAPAAAIYTLVMIIPLIETLRLSFFNKLNDAPEIFVGIANWAKLFGDPNWSDSFWNALFDNCHFFIIHMLVQNPIGVGLAALLSIQHLPGRGFYRSAFFMPTMLSFVIVGFTWRLILSPTWGISRSILHAIGLGSWFEPWLGQESTALTTLALISVWQFVGIPMMLTYAALLAIPEELLEAASLDGLTGFAQFFKIKLPLIWPTIGIISILTFVGNFNAFDLVYVSQGAIASPNYSTDLLGTFLYRIFFGNQLVLGDPYMGATIAGSMFLIILAGVLVYLFGVQRRLTYYQL
ncbi:MAG TPA: sugar ABC transporter permease [Magnetospirillaceae bacterium]|jgi:raffinose/stachyose/melibiose transport system permease protein